MRHVRRHAVPILISLMAVLAWTWPLATQVTTALPNVESDGPTFVWNIWWAKEALLVRRTTPFWASTLYYPDGTSLYFHALALATAPLTIPLQLVVDPPTALIVTLLALLWLTALATSWLLWDIVRHRAAALVGGLFVALAPAHLYHLQVGHLNLNALFPLPLILLAQRRAIQTRRRRWVAAGALAVVVCALADWQYLVLALLLGGSLLLATAWRRRRRPAAAGRALRWGGLPLVLGGLALLPLVAAMIADLEANDGYALRPAWQTERRSADLLALVAPSPYHPLWGTAGEAVYAWLYPALPYAGGVASLGLAALAVAGAAAWRRRPATRPWAGLLLAGAVLALGPSLHVGGADTGLPLPYRLLQAVPYLSVSRVPAVFLKGALLALAVLLALGLRELAARAGRGRRGRLALLGLTGLVALEGLALPLQVPARPPVSACYRLLAADPRPGAVLDLPVVDADEPMYFQTIHGRPVAGGSLSRDNPYGFLYGSPVLAQLARGQADLPDDIYLADGAGEEAALARRLLAGWGIQWVVWRPGDADEGRARMERALAHIMAGVEPVCDDGLARLWWLEAAPVVLALGDGWYDEEESGDGQPFRWMGAEAEVTVAAPRDSLVQLALTGWANDHDRSVEVWVEAERQADIELEAGEREPAAATLHLPAGRSHLRLRAVEPPTPGDGADPRLLTVAVSRLRLEAIGDQGSGGEAGGRPRLMARDPGIEASPENNRPRTSDDASRPLSARFSFARMSRRDMPASAGPGADRLVTG